MVWRKTRRKIAVYSTDSLKLNTTNITFIHVTAQDSTPSIHRLQTSLDEPPSAPDLPFGSPPLLLLQLALHPLSSIPGRPHHGLELRQVQVAVAVGVVGGERAVDVLGGEARARHRRHLLLGHLQQGMGHYRTSICHLSFSGGCHLTIYFTKLNAEDLLCVSCRGLLDTILIAGFFL